MYVGAKNMLTCSWGILVVSDKADADSLVGGTNIPLIYRIQATRYDS